MKVIKFYDSEKRIDRYVCENDNVYDTDSFIKFLCTEHEPITIRFIDMVSAVKRIMSVIDCNLINALDIIHTYEQDIISYYYEDERFMDAFDYLWVTGKEF